MIKQINLQNNNLVKPLFELQRASYLIEAKLINFFEIPPLLETINELKDCGETFLGYFEGDVLAGAVSFTMESDTLTICRMIVHPNHFRKGIAQRLLTEVENRNRKITIYKVATGKENIPAKILYLKNGYKFIKDMKIVPGLFITYYEKETTGKN
jgi:ribosomal protein S18 acetylase RimI-like enzyme